MAVAGTARIATPQQDAAAVLSPSSLSRSLLLASAAAGAAEVLIHRIGGAVAASIATPPGLARAVEAVGGVSTAVTAVLVVGGAAALLAGPDHRRGLAVGLVTLTALTVQPLDGAGLGLLSQRAFFTAVGVIVWSSSGPLWRGAAVMLIGSGMAAGQVGLLWSQPGLALRSAGEASIVAGVVILGVGTASERSIGLWGWIGAAGAGVVAGAALTVQPTYTALAALWTWGATLWLPVLAYVAAAAAAGLLLMTWLRHAHSRHLAAGLVLLGVAGLPPALAHHNITATLALIALASARWPSVEGRSR